LPAVSAEKPRRHHVWVAERLSGRCAELDQHAVSDIAFGAEMQPGLGQAADPDLISDALGIPLIGTFQDGHSVLRVFNGRLSYQAILLQGIGEPSWANRQLSALTNANTLCRHLDLGRCLRCLLRFDQDRRNPFQ